MNLIRKTLMILSVLVLLLLSVHLTAAAEPVVVPQTKVAAEVVIETTTARPGREKTNPGNLWKLVIVAAVIGGLAALYGVSDMLIRKHKMDKMQNKVRVEKGLIKKAKEDGIAKPAGVPKLDLSDLDSTDDPAELARIAEAQEFNQHPANQAEFDAAELDAALKGELKK